MPLAFACGLGGIITLVGTPPNIIASGALEQAGYRAFGFFEFAKIGIPLTLAGLVYMMFIGKHLLPKRELDANQEIEQEVEATSTSSSKMAVSGIILLVVVLVMALGIKGITLEMAAITGAIVAVLTGCLTEKQAYASIDWVTIFLFAGMMPVSSDGRFPIPDDRDRCTVHPVLRSDPVHVQHGIRSSLVPHRYRNFQTAGR